MATSRINLRIKFLFIISPINIGPNIDSWEVYPPLPDGLSITSNGSIQGVPLLRTDWINYEIWSNNTGGSLFQLADCSA